MSDVKTILCVIDPTATEHPALERAAWLARALGASLELFICDYDQYLAGGLEGSREGEAESSEEP
jgi:hypothetical protein